jgi:hypothetical protein
MTDIFAIFSTVTATASVVIAIVAMWYSRGAARAARDQAVAALNANNFARQLRQSEAVLQFTERYGDMTNGGSKFGDRNWEYQLWALYALEYFFFERGWIPEFIFELWMTELVSIYGSDEVRESHARYLQLFENHDVKVRAFYRGLQRIAQELADDRELQVMRTVQVVRDWPKVEPAL